MNWDAVSAISEAVGGVAILVSLVYVAIQIRQNTRQIRLTLEASRLAAFERNIESGNRVRELLIGSADVAEIFIKGARGLAALNESERLRFSLVLRNIFSAAQGAYIRQLSVRHDPAKHAGNARIIDELLVDPGVREWLAASDPDWRPQFRAFVQERLTAVDAGAAPPGREL